MQAVVRSLRRRVLDLYVAAVAAGGVLVGAVAVSTAAVEGVRPDPVWLAVVLFAGLVVAERFQVPMAPGENVSMGLAAAAALIFVTPGYMAAVLVSLASAAGDLAAGKERRKVVFNAGMTASYIGLATLVARVGGVQDALGRDDLGVGAVLGVLATLITAWCLNAAMMTVVRPLATGARWSESARSRVALGPLLDGGLMLQVPVIVVVGRAHPWLVPFALATNLAVLVASRSAATDRQQALHDPLTGIANRRMFDEALAEAVQRPRPGSRPAMVLVDLDGFKAVNDEVGHHAGDRVLVAVADALRDVTPTGTLVARLGGDEFGVLVPAVRDVAQAVDVAGPVAGSFPLAVAIDEGVLVQIRASVGVAVAGGDGIEGLRRAADQAMYQAKRSGSGVAISASEDRSPPDATLQAAHR